jgi:hypothetical protein
MKKVVSRYLRQKEDRPPAIRWADLPHDILWQKSLLSIATGSRERSKDDSLKHVLRPRLPQLVPSDHLRYIELECARMVELLRATRDEYRGYLEELGCKPIAEMYWVVFRFGLIPYAQKVLRAAMTEYILLTHVEPPSWRRLFGMCVWPPISLPVISLPGLRPKKDSWELSVKGTITHFTREHNLNLNLTGGLFGRDGQKILALMIPRFGGKQFDEHINERQELWDVCRPWTEGLARLYDAIRGELNFQGQCLSEDARRADLKFTELSSFQKIAYMHLAKARQGRQSRNFGDACWTALLQDLDQEGVPLTALDGTAQKVRVALLERGHRLHTWIHCYSYRAAVTLEDGKPYNLRKEVTKSIQNAAKAAEGRIGRIWNVKPIRVVTSKIRTV